jgi:hypothetical protein
MARITVTVASMLAATQLLGVVTNVAATTQGGPPSSVDERLCPPGTTLERGHCVRDKAYVCEDDELSIAPKTGGGWGCYTNEGVFVENAVLRCPIGTTETSTGKCSVGRPGPQ